MIGLGLGLSFGQGPSTPFVPTNVNGCKLWLRADKGTTIATGVSTWADQSGVGDANHNVTQATSAKRPTLNASDAVYNNQATLSFLASASQYLQSANWAVAMVQPWTLCIVGNDDGTNNKWWFDNNQSPETELFTAASVYEFSAGATLNSGVATSSSPRVFIITASGGTGTIYMNAKTAVKAGSIGTQGWAGTTLGAYYGGAFNLNGKIAEVVAYDSALGSSDRSSLFDYFGTRYGITVGA